MRTVSIGIMAYNEEANIGALLSALIEQELSSVKLLEIVVVASGCTDNTEKIVRKYSQREDKIKLLVQEKREGKASAINLFLRQAKGDIIVLESADTLPKDKALENLLKPFLDEKIGAVGACVIPVNSSSSFMGFYVQLFWRLHHRIALLYPKCGEMVAFRNVLPSIAYNTATDETWIIAVLSQMGYRIGYAKDALVLNKGPESLSDLASQRRRHLAGYIHLKKELNFKPKTMDNLLVLRLLPSCIKFNLKEIVFTLGVIILEVSARILANYDWYIKKRNPYIWEMAKSTKSQIKPQINTD